jgi:cation transport regulator ChaB
MINFRKARDTMGFRHTSAYVPNAQLANFSIYVERLKAERMMELIKEPITSEARIALAQCNYIDIPTHYDFNNAIERYKQHKDLVNQAKEAIGYAEAFRTAASAAKASEDADDYVKWQSIAVANNAMAAVIWREIIYAAQEVNGART